MSEPHDADPSKARTLVTALLLTLTLTLACGRRTPPPEERPARRYPLTGIVRSVDLPEGLAQIAHDEIPGFMEAMTMPFAVNPREQLRSVTAGDRIRATLVVTREKSWLEDLTVTGKAPPETPSVPSAKRVVVPPARPGDSVPDFALIDQAGRPVTRAAYRNRILVTTFFFTYCPLPDYCPRMSESFGTLERTIVSDPRLSSRVRLLSISFDPERDTPAVLTSYGRRFHDERSGPPFAIWTLATGTPGEVRKLADFFGVSFQKDGGSFIHGLATTIVDGKGQVVRTFFGNTWQPEEILTELRSLTE